MGKSPCHAAEAKHGPSPLTSWLWWNTPQLQCSECKGPWLYGLDPTAQYFSNLFSCLLASPWNQILDHYSSIFHTFWAEPTQQNQISLSLFTTVTEEITFCSVLNPKTLNILENSSRWAEHRTVEPSQFGLIWIITNYCILSPTKKERKKRNWTQ